MKIDAPPGVVAFSAVGIFFSPGSASDTLVLRGLTLKALVPGIGVGVQIVQGHLFLENGVVDGWETGVSIENSATNSKVFVKHSVVRNNGVGLAVKINTAVAALESTFFEKNIIGVSVTGGKVALTRSVASGNTVGFQASGASSLITLQFCQVTNNAEGVRTQFAGVARVSDSAIAGNTIFGLNNPASEGGGGTLERFGTNLMSGNGANFGGAVTLGTLQ